MNKSLYFLHNVPSTDTMNILYACIHFLLLVSFVVGTQMLAAYLIIIMTIPWDKTSGCDNITVIKKEIADSVVPPPSLLFYFDSDDKAKDLITPTPNHKLTQRVFPLIVHI